MPITQERFLEAINAGLDIWNALEKTAKAIRDHHDNTKDFKANPQDALDLLVIEFGNPEQHLLDATSPDILRIDRTWFKRFGKRNDAERRAQQRRRERDNSGIAPAPATRQSPTRPARQGSDLISADRIDPNNDPLDDMAGALHELGAKRHANAAPQHTTEQLQTPCTRCTHTLDLHEGGPCRAPTRT